MKTIEADYKKTISEYTKAVKEGRGSFFIDGNEVLTSYAYYYLIHYHDSNKLKRPQVLSMTPAQWKERV